MKIKAIGISKNITQSFKEFILSNQFSGILLIFSAATSLFLSNNILGHSFEDFWHIDVGISFGNISFEKPIEFWVNEIGMSFFFLLVGLEIKRELFVGELNSRSKATLPIAAAIGGMLVPAIIYSLINIEKPTLAGWAIPTATDIAFALGILALLGSKVPVAIKVFLTALAVVDDLGAVLIIAIFYTKEILIEYLIYSAVIFALLVVFNLTKLKRNTPFIILGAFLWYCFYKTGIHPTLAGVIVAFCIPMLKGSSSSPLRRLENTLHTPITFLIMPLFALVNCAMDLGSNSNFSLFDNLELGIFLGLIIGKPLGIFGISFLATKFNIATLPQDVNWKHMFGVSILGGIGFTMSIFICNLSFTNQEYINLGKLSIFISSAVAAILGLLFLYFSTSKTNEVSDNI
jgi:Na+:H+ antiporter, NhaA family